MADNNNKNIKKDSLLKQAVIASPFIGTASFFAKQGLTSSTSQQIRLDQPTIQRAVRNSRITGLDQRSRKQFDTFLLDTLSAEGVNSDPVAMQKLRSAWEQAINGTSAFELSKLPKSIQSFNNVPLNQTVETIREYAKNNSNLMSHIYSKFAQNWQALSSSANQFHKFQSVKNLRFPSSLNTPTNLPKFLQESLSKIGAVNLTSTLHTNTGLPSGMGMYSIGMDIAGTNLNFNLPIAPQGSPFLLEGTTQSSRRINQGIGIFDQMSGKVQQMDRSEFFMKELQESIIPDIKSGRLKSKFDAQNAVNSLYEKVYGSLESVPNIDPSKLGPAAENYVKTRSSAIRLFMKSKERKLIGKDFVPSYVSLDSNQTLQAIKESGGTLFGGVGSHTAEGLAQTVNVIGQDPFWEATNWARKPESAIRNFDLTLSSREMYKSSTPKLKTLYVEQSIIDQMGQGGRGLFGEGHALGRASLSNTTEFQWGSNIHLKSTPDMPLDQFQQMIAENKLKVGDVLGFDINGQPIRMTEEMKILSVQGNRTIGKGDFVTLDVLNTRRLKNNEKFFGDWKALLRLQDDLFFQSTVRKITNNDSFMKNVDVIVSMDELKKDPRKFANQIFSGFEDIAGISPPGFAKSLRDRAMSKGTWSNEDFIRGALQAAQGPSFNTSRLANIFGAVPAVLGKDVATEIFKSELGEQRASQLQSMIGKFSYGISNVAYGGPEELRGAGSMGSLEPRSFEAFQGPAFKGMGDELTEDFIKRTIASDPRKYETFQGLKKSLQSMTGELKPSKGANIIDLTQNLASEDIRSQIKSAMESKGGWLRPGKGLHDIYVPGLSEMESLSPFQTAAGKEVTSDIASLYHKLGQEGARLSYDVSPASLAEVKANMAYLTSQIHKQAAPGGKGAGAFLRGKVIGSRYLTGVDTLTTNATNLKATEVGISDSMADQMFKEMAQHNYDVANMKSRFKAGETIGGIIARHPTFGEYSLQQVGIKRVAGNLPQIAIPEFNLSVKANGMPDPINIKLGSMLGMAGDKDADIFSLMLVKPSLEKQVLTNVTSPNSEYLSAYTKHQVRFQMLKASKAKDIAGLTTMESMLGGAANLAVVPEWVPELSLQMTESRRAVRSFASGKAAADAEMLLTWLEQTPISSKHMSVRDAAEGKIGSLMAQLSSSFSGEVTAEKATSVKEIINEITKGNAQAEAFLNQGITLTDDSAAAIAKTYGLSSFDTNIGGTNVSQAIETLWDARSQYARSSFKRDTDLLNARNASIKTNEISKFAHLLDDINLSNNSLTAAFNSAQEMLGNITDSLIKNKKAIGFGLGASLILGTVLSSPKQNIGPGAAIIPPEGLIKRSNSSGSGLRPEDINPTPQRQMGQPSVPSFTSTNTVSRLAIGSGNRNLTVRGTLPASIDNRGIGNIGRIIGSGGSGTSVNLRDNRSRINEYAERNK